MKGDRTPPPFGTDFLLIPPAVLQRVASASVTVDKDLISSIGRGILVFAAIGPNDTRKDAETMAAKVLKMKMWPDESGSSVRQTR
jgi:D-aminoacyl-tRNA deacylase